MSFRIGLRHRPASQNRINADRLSHPSPSENLLDSIGTEHALAALSRPAGHLSGFHPVAPYAAECLGAFVVCCCLYPQLRLSSHACATRSARKRIGLQRLKLKHEPHHTVPKLCILGFESLK